MRGHRGVVAAVLSLLVGLLLLASVALADVWSGQTSGTTQQLNGVACPSGSACFAVGASGTIQVTTNTGSSWSAQTSGTSQALDAVSCPSASACFAVGGKGTILATSNAGSSWSSQSSGVTGNTVIYGVSCPSTSVCFASVAGGKVDVTTNSGSSWTLHSSSSGNNLQAISCPSTSACFAVGASGTIVATTNGGSSWTTQTSGTSNALYGVWCTSTTACLAVGASGTILATTNGGTSWAAQTSGTTSQLDGVSCQSSGSCWTVGASGTVLERNSGGSSWTAQTSGTTNQLYGNSCPSGSCVAVGASGTIVETNAPTNTAAPSVSGTDRDASTLTAANGTWSGSSTISYSYQWEDCNTSGASCQAITGATSQTYKLASTDVGDTVRMVATGSNLAGSSSATSTQTGVVQALAPSNTTVPTVSGTAKDGQALTVANGSWSGSTPLTYSYQWQDCNSSGGSCQNITGATGQTYTLHSSDVADTIKVTVTASNASLPGGGSASASSIATGVVQALPPANTAVPSVSGTAEDGQALTAANGSWSGSTPLTYSYQWQDCNSSGGSCQNITGATGQTYTLHSSDVADTIKVTVTASNASLPGGGSASASSTATGTIQPAPPSNTGAPSVSGIAQDGQTLTAASGAWSGTPPLSYAYQWETCDASGANCQNISAATSTTYALTSTQVGATMRVKVTATNQAGPSSATSTQTGVVQALVPSDTTLPTVSGSAQDGQTLTAANGAWSGSTPLTYGYQWQDCNSSGGNCQSIAGATGQSYTLTSSYVGDTIEVTVTASNASLPGGGNASATSALTAVVQPTAPSNTSPPTVSGTAQQGQTLTAANGSWSGTTPMSYTYQWESCDTNGANCQNITGASSANYTAVASDVGQTLRVMVSAGNYVGSAQSTSGQTPLVQPPGRPQATAFGFGYDDLGRLIEASDPSGSTAVYHWDATGNLKQITNASSSSVSVAQLSPQAAAVGATVEIYGTGFSTTASQDQVSFNGFAATVSSATTSQLVVSVPTGAASGVVSVTTPDGSANSPSAFTVNPADAPTVSSISTNIASAGTALTVTGSNFDATTANNNLVVNKTRALITQDSASTLTTSVPLAAGSGAVSVATPHGVATGPDLYVPPPGYSSSSVVQTGRLTPGIGKTVSFGSSSGIAMLIFDATAGEQIFVNVTNSSLGGAPGNISLYDPYNNQVLSEGFGPIDTTTLTTTGTYMVLLAPERTGSATITVDQVPPTATASLTPSQSGGSATITTTVPGQNAQVTFQGTAGEQISMNFSGDSYQSYGNALLISLLNPDGTTAMAPTGEQGNFYIDTITLQQTGTFTLVINPSSNNTGSLTTTIYQVPPPAGGSLTPSASGGSATTTTASPGQYAEVTFQGTAGEQISMNFSGDSYQSYGNALLISLLNPDGTTAMAPTGEQGNFYIDTITLQQTGTFTLVINPSSNNTGSLTTTIYQVPPPAGGSLTPSASGGSATTTTASPGQYAEVTFQGTAGEQISMNFSGDSYQSYGNALLISLLNPDGTTAMAPTGEQGNFYIDTITLQQTGTFTLVINPSSNNTGSLTTTIYQVPPPAGGSLTPSASGGSATTTTASPGQYAEVTFQGTAGEQISMNFSGDSYQSYGNALLISLLNPDGTTAMAPTGEQGNFYIDTITLQQTGTFTLVINPSSNNTGSLTTTIYQVPPPAGGSLTIGGPAVNVSIATPGQNGALTFSGTPGTGIHLQASNVTISNSTVTIDNPDSSQLASLGVGTGGGTIAATLAQTGTYQVIVDPQGAATGSMTLTLTDPPAERDAGLLENPPTGPSAGIQTGPAPIAQFASYRSHAPKAVTSTETAIRKGSSARARLKPRLIAFIAPPSAARRAILRLGTRPAVSKSQKQMTRRIVGGGRVTFIAPPQAARHVILRLGTARVSTSHKLMTRSIIAEGRVAFIPPPAAARKRILALGAQPASARVPRPHHAAIEGRRPKPGGSRGPRQRGGSHPAGSGSGIRFQTRAAPFWSPRGQNFRGDWTTGRVSTPWTGLPMLSANSGVTAVAGQVLKLNGLPLAAVRVSIEGTDVAAHTDKTGRFLLSAVPAGHRVLDVDGSRARSRRQAGFASFEIGVELHKKRTTTMPFTIWLPQLDRAHTTKLQPVTRHQLTLTTPHIPGLQLRIPAGSTITAPNGRPVRHLSVIPVPVDRPPFPLPMGSYFPIYVSVQPAGAYVSKGAEIIYPNYSHLPAGQRVPFWNYDPGGRGWYIYGEGTVSKNAKQIIPNPGVRLWRFTGAMISGSLIPPWLKNFFEGLIGADPVNLGSGLFTYQKTDLQEPDVLPITLTRYYRPADSNSYSFGIGMTNAYDMRLFSQNNYNSAELILPDGMDIHYVNDSGCYPNCSAYANALFEAQNTPTEFHGSVITFNGNGWSLRLRNGMTYLFPDDQSYGLIGIRDRFGNEVTITRNSAGGITQVTASDGRWISFTNDSNNRITSATDNSGRTVYYDYNGQTGPSKCSGSTNTGPTGTLRCVKDANGGETYYTYDPTTGWMTQIKDARGNVFLTDVYDSNGRVTQQTRGNETTPTNFSYQLNSGGQVTQSTMTSPNGNQTVTNLNSDGFPSSTTLGAGTSDAETTQYSWQSGSDLLQSETDQLGRETTFGYDSLGNVSSITQDATGSSPRTTNITYDPTYSEPTQITDPNQKTTYYGYDSTGELTSIKDPNGNTTTMAYASGDGQATSVTDPYQKTTTYGYEFGDPYSVTDPDGNTSYTYLDAGGRLVSSTDAVGNTTRYAYDNLNDLTSVTDPDGHQTQYGYDADGDLVSTQDANQHTTAMSYDNEDRLSSIQDALGNTWNYSYDGDNNLTSVQDPDGHTITYTPDALDRLSSALYKNSDGSTQSTINYTYDLGNRLRQIADSTGGTFTETPDDFDELIQESGPNGTISYGYNPDGTKATSTVSGQPHVSYGYNNDAQLTSISQGGQNVGLSYDNDGRLIQTALPDAITENYNYDPASRLTSIDYDNSSGSQIGDLDYAYDPNGNQTAEWGSNARLTIPQTTPQALYNAANQLESQGATSYAYDRNGNLTADGSNTYTYNARNQVTTLNGPTNASFQYDPFGRREQGNINGTTTSYLDDGSNVAQELQGGSPTVNYLLGPGLDQLYARTDQNGTQSYLIDALGSTLALANSDQSQPTTYTYDPFGQTSVTGTPSANPYQYAGMANDGTGLYYDNARYYDPSQANFTTPDPLGQSGSGTDLYRYTGDDPTNATDPTGQQSVFDKIANSLPSGPVFCLAKVLSGAKDLAGSAGCAITSVLALSQPELLGDGGVEDIGNGFLDDPAETCDFNSFTASTPVLLANGKRESIRKLKVGDYVTATDPITGKTGPHKVIELINDSGIKHMVNVTLADGETLHATDHHPFWDMTAGRFVYATDLHAGDKLESPDAKAVDIAGLHRYTTYQHVYNLQIQGIHTFYVGHTSVLVHNECGDAEEGSSVAEQIANGHAFDKHIGEFPGISTPEELQQEIENVMGSPDSLTRDLSNGRTAYYDEDSNTLVITNPSAADGGTVFKPTGGLSYVNGLR